MLETTTMVAIVMVVTEIIKRTFDLKTNRFIPVISLVLGLVYVLGLTDLPIREAIFTGILVGAGASGLYDVGKKTVLNK